MSDRLGSISESYRGEGEEDEGETSEDGKTGLTGESGSSNQTSSTGNSGSDGTTGETSSTSTSSDSSESSEDSGNIKDKNPVLAMYPPEEVKEEYESTWDDIQVLCKLADEEQPRKISEYSAAILENGYSNLEELCHELGLSEAYDEYSSVVED